MDLDGSGDEVFEHDQTEKERRVSTTPTAQDPPRKIKRCCLHCYYCCTIEYKIHSYLLVALLILIVAKMQNTQVRGLKDRNPPEQQQLVANGNRSARGRRSND